MEYIFQLLKVAIGNRNELTRQLTVDEWVLLYSEFKKHALLGIGYVGITKLTKEQAPPINVLAQWMHDAEQIRKKNLIVTAECERLGKQLKQDGVWACILKGQSNLVNYPENVREYRTPGDIDVWCVPQSTIQIAEKVSGSVDYVEYRGERAVIEYALMQSRLADKAVPEVRYHHVELPDIWPVDVEIHHRPSFMCSPVRNVRLRDWCRRFECVNDEANINEHAISVPSPSFNAIYQLVHIYRHLFDEGIGLRQILDYYFVLRSLHVEQETHLIPPCEGGGKPDHLQSMAMWEEGLGRSVLSNQQIMHTLGRLGMKKFASAVMYVLQTAFAMPDEYLICKPNEKEGKFLLNEILQAGNFGRYDTRIKHGGGQFSHAIEKTKHNFRLLTHYPEEVLWEPAFRVYHWMWRRFEWWKIS